MENNIGLATARSASGRGGDWSSDRLIPDIVDLG